MDKIKKLGLYIVKKLKANYQLYVILLLSSLLNLYNLKIEGYANEYYAAGVKSMTMNLKNFFFVSFDPSGFVSIDKPPIGFWLQGISAKIFGFSGWSIILPQAIAGVISVWLLYYTVNRVFGKIAGLIGALCLSITPIFVAASRNNTIDNILVLTSILACLFISIAAEKGSLKYLLLSVVFVGIGFNVKMLQAYMILPAIYLTYIISCAISLKKRIQHLILGTIVLTAVSLSWTLVVDLIPAENRPFVGSSTNNTVMELIAGHNGSERLDFGIYLNPVDREKALNAPEKKNNDTPKTTNNGNPGVARLFSENNLSDQISWLLPFALLGLIVSVVSEKWKSKTNMRIKLNLVLWGTCLIPEFIYFSFIRGMAHCYYLTMMSPSISALVGIGSVSMLRLYKKGGVKAAMLPMALIVNGALELLILSYYGSYPITKKIMLFTGVLSFTSSIILSILIYIRSRKPQLEERKSVILRKVLLTVAFIGVLIAPAFWSFTTVVYKMSGSSPAAGLRLVNSKNQEINAKDWLKEAPNGNATTEKLIKFLDSHEDTGRYQITVEKANDVADFIIRTGEPVMTIGGFSGRDKILTLDEFKSMVKSGEIKYVLLGKDENENKEITNWVRKNGKIFDLNNGDGNKEDENFKPIYELN